MIHSYSVYYPLYHDKQHFVVLITGGRGCESPNQRILMADMTVKEIKNVRVGDKVMGDDGTPRTVLDVHEGEGKLYDVHQNNADDYIVNDGHILALKKSYSAKNDNQLNKHGERKFPNGRYPDYPDIVDMPIEDYIAKSKRFRYHFRGYKAGCLPYKEQPVKIDPYLLGLWLGDGTAKFPRITNPEEEVKAWLQNYCDKNGLRLYSTYKQGAYHMGIVSDGKIGHNTFLNALKEYGLIENKHIPQEYIANSVDVRLQLLAGLLDTDGSYDSWGYDIIQKREELARQIKLIADTLGFRTHLKVKRGKIGDKDCGVYYRVMISGDVWRIPCNVARKKAKKGDSYNSRTFLESSLTISDAGYGKWVGIEVDGNHRYLHDDGTVQHNSGKSYSASTFIERLTFEYNKQLGIAHKILYTRYTMVSAAISVIPEVKEKIETDGTEKFFKSTKTDIINKLTGAQIMFRGIHTSSGNQTAKLKSIQGITTFVVDEAEEWTSEEDFERIMLSIRQQGLQNRIIIIMNPADSNHWVYKRFIEKTHKIEYFDGVPVQISTHPNVLHIHTTYLDNIEHLSTQFLDEVLAMKESDPDRYAHIVIGRWSDVAEGAVFKHIGIVDTFPENAKHIARGMDFGYSKDSTAIIRCGIIDKRLYLDELCYKTGMTSQDIIDELVREQNIGEDGFVYADSADPRLIDEIALGGVIIYPVRKGQGSILAGISKMQTYEIFVTRRSVNLQDEFRKYVWAKDKDGHYINYPEDHDNHGVDASRYYILGKIMGRLLNPKTLNKDDLGIY
jgi:phage terminase large subunit